MDYSTLVSELLAICHRHSSSQKSSHWSSLTSGFRFTNGKVTGISGFSPRSIRIPIFSFYLHALLQWITFPNYPQLFASSWYKLVDRCLAKQHRALDNDACRHAFTFALLSRFLDLSKCPVVCCIGDGQANFVGPALESRIFQKVISVNLPEVLLSDLELLKLTSYNSNSISVCKTSEDLSRSINDESIRLIMIPAGFCDILFRQSINLFVNIASFGEMENQSIEKYFQIIKSSLCGSFFYCCNRSEKKLIGGECTRFDAYPWSSCDDILIDELCPWHQRFYTIMAKKYLPIPRVNRLYDGVFHHRLVHYPVST